MQYKLIVDYVNGERKIHHFGMDMTLIELEKWISSNSVKSGFYLPSENSFNHKNGFIFINTRHILYFTIIREE